MGRVLSGMIVLVLFSSILVSTVSNHVGEVKAPTGYPVHNLSTGLNYTTIQGAIDAPETLDEHALFVEEGIYYEGLLINKSICLLGENKYNTIIDGTGYADPAFIEIEANNVTVQGFTIRNHDNMWVGPAIYFKYCSFGNLTDVIVEDNRCTGISLTGNHTTVSNSLVTRNSPGISVLGDGNSFCYNTITHNGQNGISAQGIRMSFYNNNISNNGGSGIDQRSPYNITIEGNIISNNADHGIIVDGSQSCDFPSSYLNWTKGGKIRDNTIVGNAIGIRLWCVENLEIMNNSISHCRTGSGIDVWDSSKAHVENNMLLYNSQQGVVIYASNGTIVERNFVSYNSGGFFLDGLRDAIILDNWLSYNDYCGIEFYGHNTTIENNKVVYGSRVGVPSDSGILIRGGQGNRIQKNIIADNENGMLLRANGDNIVMGNVIANSTSNGIIFEGEPTEMVFHNNFINNTNHVFIEGPWYWALWDQGFEGNFWDDYTGIDSNKDGVGDMLYTVGTNNTDHYPLMGMFSDFVATSEHSVQTICNSSIVDFHFNGTAINFNVTGENSTAGFCRICIPKALMTDSFRVFVNGTEILPSPELLTCSNSTHSYLYFNYSHSTQEVIIVPEFPSLITLPLFMTATLLAAILYRKHRFKSLS